MLAMEAAIAMSNSPKELLVKLGWHEGDVINVDIVDEQLLLTKVNG